MAKAASSASSPRAGPSSSSPQQAGGGVGGDAHTPRQRQGRPVRAGSDPLLIVCGCFSVVTAATALLCVAVNVVSAVQSFRAGSNIFGGIFRCYAIIFSLFVAVLETEWGFIIRFWKEIASYMLLACGAVYVISGILCIGVLKRSRQQKATSREQAVKDLHELEKRREELEALLLAERSELV